MLTLSIESSGRPTAPLYSSSFVKSERSVAGCGSSSRLPSAVERKGGSGRPHEGLLPYASLEFKFEFWMLSGGKTASLSLGATGEADIGFSEKEPDGSIALSLLLLARGPTTEGKVLCLDTTPTGLG